MSAAAISLHDEGRPTSAGFREIDVATLASRGRGAARLVDVREAAEFHGELGHVPGAELVPMGELFDRCVDWDRDAEVVLLCRTGRRSASAAMMLLARGFRRVVNVAGGTVAHVAAGLPVER